MRNVDVKRALSVLVVEDSEDDALLIVRELRRGGYEVDFERVDTAADMQAALARRPWNLVIADHAMPQFCGLAALQVLKDSALDLPFIIVSGAIGEDVAVEAMRCGAHDYVMKDKLARLVPAVERELREAEGRRERREAEASLRHAERLAALGTFAAGVAHEINNPLAAILLTARQGLGTAGQPQVVGAALREILEDAERCARIVANVLQFARKQPSLKAPVSLADVLRTACEQARKYASEQRVRVELRLPDGLPAVQANATDLEQVFVNLLMNAIQASRPRQVVKISASASGARVQVHVQDRGLGMDKATSARAFDPFFTTRPDRGGTGLGLSMAHGIVADHGGEVCLDSRPGRGTTVTVDLPCSTADAEGGGS